MQFRTTPVNRATRIVAALVLMGFGGLSVYGALFAERLLGVALLSTGLGVILFEAWRYGSERLNRPDPYDLSLLKDTPIYRGPSRDDPNDREEEPAYECDDENVVYCYRCDVSMPAHYDICPRCGNFLGR